MRSRERYLAGPRCWRILFAKEWRNIVSGRAFWFLLLVLCPLVGYGYVQAIALYGEASRSSARLPEVARNLSPLDGILVPTFGALYLANTFLYPFVAIRSIAHEKETGSLKLLLQVPPSVGAILTAKVVALVTAWLVVAAPSLTAVVLWAAGGGHVALPELSNLLLGHFLYGAVVTGFAVLAAALADSSATAAIITLAATLGVWVLDFAAAGDSGILKSLADLSPTALLRGFEHGIFSLGAVLGTLAAALGLVFIAGVLINSKLTASRKLSLSAITVLIVGALVSTAPRLRVYADAAEDQRNSLSPADANTLRSLRQRLTIVVRLAPEDPRYIDFERNVLSKLQHTVADAKIVLESQSRTGALEEASETYGTILYQYGGKQAESRSTGTGEILPLIYDLAGVERQSGPPATVYPGYPLEASSRAAEVLFYWLLPLVVLAGWAATNGVPGLSVFRRGCSPVKAITSIRRANPGDP